MMLLAGGHDLVHNEYQTINQFARVRLHSALINKSEQMSNEMSKKVKANNVKIVTIQNGFYVRCKKFLKVILFSVELSNERQT